MTHHEPDTTTIAMALELLTEHGLEGVGCAVEILINEAMQLERSAFLEAGPHERTEDRRGYANGFRAKRLKTRLGELELKIPRVRNLPEGVDPFYPKALERGERSERALKLAVAQMYVEGVSTRKVTEITRELCGQGISSTQVSRAAKLLDEEISKVAEPGAGRVQVPDPRCALREGAPRGQRPRLRRVDGRRCRRGRQAKHPWCQRGTLRSGSPLADLPGRTSSAGAVRDADDHERRSQRVASCPEGSLPGHALAAVPVPSAAER